MPNTTRRTSNKKVTVKVKPTKTKKVKKKRTGKTATGKTLTAALNTYKSVKSKIGLNAAGKQRRQAKRADRANDIPVRKRMQVISDDTPIQRITDGSALTEDLKYSINPISRKMDYESAVNSQLLGGEKVYDDLEIYATKKPKKDNTLMYLLLALVAAFVIYKMTAKK